MKVLDKISIRTMLSHRHKCSVCLGKGYVFAVIPRLDATKFRLVLPCPCVQQIVRIEEDKK